MPKKAKSRKTGTKKQTRKPSAYKNPWMYSTLIVLIIFAGFVLYEKSVVFHKGVNSILGLEDTIVVEDPPINLTVINDETIKDMPYDMDEQIETLEDEIDAEIITTKMDISENEAGELIKQFEIKSLPVLIFDNNLENTEFYEEAAAFFTDKEEYYIMKIKPVKYLETPEPGNGKTKGSQNEPQVTIIAYNSFSCPYSGIMKDVFDQTVAEYPEKVKYVYKHFDRGGVDMILANATECSAEQEKFWEMHDYFYDNQDKLKEMNTGDFISQAAAETKLDAEAFNTCVEENRYKNLVNEQTKEAHLYGINGTPGIFVNDKFVGGAVSYDTMKEIVDSFIQ